MPGARRFASATGVPVFTPCLLASIEAATQMPCPPSTAVMATGRPLNAGSSCCSTEAKKLFMSR